jgi:flagellar motor protein MotB
MAGHGGGAWKVAYADFVTAMMAFFLVMWIVAQDQKIKEAVAHYFIDPMGYFPVGNSNSPSKTGGLFDARSHGRVPDSQSVAMGRGRSAHSDSRDDGTATKLVSDWLHADSERYAAWHETALMLLKSEEEGTLPPDTTAASQLAQLLRTDYYDRVPLADNGVYRDLLLEQLANVNWDELAVDLLLE